MGTQKMSYFKHACLKKGESFNKFSIKSNYINLVYSRKYCFKHDTMIKIPLVAFNQNETCYSVK